MNDSIVTREECAACRYCCVFEESELSELPIIPNEMKRVLEKQFPALRFQKLGDCWVFRAKVNENGSYDCPMLSEKGCILGDKKPFDCMIYPYCIMRRDDNLVITITPECKKACGKPLEQILSVLERGLANRIFEAAEAYPDLVRDYETKYPILMWLSKQ